MIFNGRKVTDISIWGESDDIQVMEAYFDDDGSPLTDDELDQLQEENGDELYNLWFEKQIDRADYFKED